MEQNKSNKKNISLLLLLLFLLMSITGYYFWNTSIGPSLELDSEYIPAQTPINPDITYTTDDELEQIEQTPEIIIQEIAEVAEVREGLNLRQTRIDESTWEIEIFAIYPNTPFPNVSEIVINYSQNVSVSKVSEASGFLAANKKINVEQDQKLFSYIDVAYIGDSQLSTGVKLATFTVVGSRGERVFLDESSTLGFPNVSTNISNNFIILN